MTATANSRSYDLAMIGSGGAAFAAAIRATNLGRRVVMIERGTVGGTCVNTGCVPSKALLATAEARHVTLDASRFPCRHVTDLLDTRLDVIDRQLAELAQLRTTIADLREDAAAGDPATCSPEDVCRYL